MPGVRHEVSVNGDGLAVVLVCPAGVVAVDLDAEGNVSQEGHHVGLPIVESLQRGQVGLEKDLSPRTIIHLSIRYLQNWQVENRKRNIME